MNDTWKDNNWLNNGKLNERANGSVRFSRGMSRYTGPFRYVLDESVSDRSDKAFDKVEAFPTDGEVWPEEPFRAVKKSKLAESESDEYDDYDEEEEEEYERYDYDFSNAHLEPTKYHDVWEIVFDDEDEDNLFVVVNYDYDTVFLNYFCYKDEAFRGSEDETFEGFINESLSAGHYIDTMIGVSDDHKGIMFSCAIDGDEDANRKHYPMEVIICRDMKAKLIFPKGEPVRESVSAASNKPLGKVKNDRNPGKDYVESTGEDCGAEGCGMAESCKKKMEESVQYMDVKVDFPIAVNRNGMITKPTAIQLLNYLLDHELFEVGKIFFVTDSRGKFTDWEVNVSNTGDCYYLICEVEVPASHGRKIFTNALCFKMKNGRPCVFEMLYN